MSIIGLKKQQWDDIESKLGGFSLCPAGSGLLFEITSHREGIYTDKKTGQEVEYITLACSHTDTSGIKHDHWEFFNLTDKDLPYIKGFLEKIERQDIFDMGEDAEWSVLYGTAFTCDIRHRVKDKETKELQSNMVRNTITAISHEDGSVVPNWQEQVGLEVPEDDDEEEEEKPKAKKSKKVSKKKVKAKVQEPEEEEEEEEEEGEEDTAPPSRSRRRSRRAERED